MLLQPAHVGLGDARVGLHREEQRDVDVPALGDHRLDRGDALRRSRNLHHQVRPADASKPVADLLDRPRRIMGQERGDLDRDKPVGAAGLVEDRPERVAGGDDVLGDQRLVRFGDARPPCPQPRKRLFIFGTFRDRLLEDGRVARHPGESIFLDEPSQFARANELPVDVVQPDALPDLPQQAQRILGLDLSHDCLRPFSRSLFAVSTTCSGVKPNSRITTGPGAEAPNRFTPMIAPSDPT